MTESYFRRNLLTQKQSWRQAGGSWRRGWRLLEASGNSWRLLEAPGPGGSWRLLEASGGSWRLLEAPGGFWRLLEASGGFWLLEASGALEASGGSCTLPGDPEARLEPGWRQAEGRLKAG